MDRGIEVLQTYLRNPVRRCFNRLYALFICLALHQYYNKIMVFLKQGVSMEEAMPGAVIAVQTFGDFLNFNPHLHIIATDGRFANNGDFVHGIAPTASDLEIPFRRKVLDMLKHEGKITDAVIENMVRP